MSKFLLLLALLAAESASLRWSKPEYAGVLADPELDEVSGLAASRAHPGIYWAQNDGGNAAQLIAIKLDGSRVASLTVAGAENVDWEDLDAFDLGGKHYLLVADTGDNGGIRKLLNLYVIEEPAQLRDGDSLRPAWIIPFRWPDGARDCEASAVDPVRGEVLLISKKRVPPELFRVRLRPADDGVQTAELVTVLPGIDQPSREELEKNPVYGRYRSQISGADLSPNGRVLAVLNYHSVHLYVRAPGQDWVAAMKQRPGRLDFPWLPQAEGIAFSPDGRSLLLGSEQRPSPLLLYRAIP
ncbi:MAG: hypothetical protein ABI588_07385 [Arenimonas sp.]